MKQGLKGFAVIETRDIIRTGQKDHSKSKREIQKEIKLLFKL